MRVMGVTLVLVLTLVSGPAAADMITLTLDGVSVGACNETWYEASCAMEYVPTTAEDYSGAGYCFYANQPTEVWVMPARLSVDLSGIQGITGVEVDITEASDPGRTRAFLYNRAGVEITHMYSGMMGAGLFMLDAAGQSVGSVAVSGHEAVVKEIRIYGDNIVATGEVSWSTLKSVF